MPISAAVPVTIRVYPMLLKICEIREICVTKKLP